MQTLERTRKEEEERYRYTEGSQKTVERVKTPFIDLIVHCTTSVFHAY